MKQKVVVTIGIISVVLLVSIIYYMFRPTYGNDNHSINKIVSENAIITRPISIIDVIDFKEYRFAGFAEGEENLGIAIFKKDENDNYKLQSIEKKSSNNTTFYVPIFEKDVRRGIYGVDIIVSNNPDLAKVKRVVNDKYIDEKEINGLGMMLLEIDIPESKMQKGIYFYDTDGKLLKQ